VFAFDAQAHLGSSDGVLGLAASVTPALGAESLVVVLTKLHAVRGPRVEVAAGGNGAAPGALVHTVGDVLVEGRGTLDGGLVDLGVLPDVVDRAVAGDLAHLGALSRASAVAGVLLDVVLNKRVGGPSVDGNEDCSGSGGGRAREVDLSVRVSAAELRRMMTVVVLPGGSGLPSLTDNKVASVGEVDRVAVVRGAELDVAGSLVVLVVVLTTGKAVGVELEVRKVGLGSSGRSSEGASNGGESKSELGEGNHFDYVYGLRRLL
jgi:hypothetical protein